jgi:DNA-binding NtrC family response regulator
MRYGYPPLLRPILRNEDSSSSIHGWGIRKFVVLIGLITMMAVLAIFGFSLYKIATYYLNQAFSRNAMLRTTAQAHDIDSLLRDTQYELEYLARLPMTAATMTDYLNNTPAKKRNRYRELAFAGKTRKESFVLLNTKKRILEAPFEQATSTPQGILSQFEQMNIGSDGLKRIQISDPVEVIYPTLSSEDAGNALLAQVIRMSAPVYGPNGENQGRIFLSLDLAAIRQILSLHTSKQSPLHLWPQDEEQKRSFFFNTAGWLIFQSEHSETSEHPLSVDALRTGVEGDIGHPQFHSAFRPSFENNLYWTMVMDTQAGKAGQMMVGQAFGSPTSVSRSHYLSYVPIIFNSGGKDVSIIGGIGCEDASFLFMASSYKMAGSLSVCFLVGAILVLCFMYLLGYKLAKQLNLLYEAVEARLAGDDHRPLNITPLLREIGQFQRSINILMWQIQIARHDTMALESQHENDRMRQLIDLEREIQGIPGLDPQLLAHPFHGIVGAGEAVVALRRQILKAAGVLADVLIIGETGTGKELAAEAIHKSGYRANGPFLSINCGALDENLLMDALFGHVKGAFSDARDDRRGAFIAASSGTLHLDEIGNASLKVQQALLRALSVRRITPLGSDRDMPFDARVIAATNVDLLQSAANGTFREDLYYRLAVITVHTPPLRARKEDIPVLVNHFLKKYVNISDQGAKEISRGALEKLMRYDWPGNIRELENCITRSLTFAEGNQLLSEHILFHAPGSSENRIEYTPPENAATNENSTTDMPAALNPRQRKAWPIIALGKKLSRGDYQKAVGDNISVRTAQYDLYDLVEKGLLRKTGRGPTSRYIFVTGGEKQKTSGETIAGLAACMWAVETACEWSVYAL